MIKEFIAVTRVFTSRLPYVVFFATARCNFKCSHCFYWKRTETSNKEKELKFNEIQKISKNLGKIYYLSLTGGEPTLRKDITDVIKLFYKQNDVKQIIFHSNGSNPERLYQITKDVLKSCHNMIFIVSLSIDDFEKNHDKIRSAKGSFKKVIKSIEMLKTFEKLPNFEIALNTVLMHHNKKNVIRLHDFIVNKLNVSHDVSYIRGDVRDYKTKDDILKTYKEIAKIIEEQGLKKENRSKFLQIRDYLMQISKNIVIDIEENKENIPPCQALRKSVVINETGDIFPCEMLNESLGNLRDYEYDINRILNTKKAKKIKEWIKKTKCKCTWECIIPVNVIFSFKGRIKLIKRLFNYFRLSFYKS